MSPLSPDIVRPQNPDVQNPTSPDMERPRSAYGDERPQSPEFLEILVTSSSNLPSSSEVCIWSWKFKNLFQIYFIFQRDAILMDHSDETNNASDCSSTSAAASSLLVPVPPIRSRMIKYNSPY